MEKFKNCMKNIIKVILVFFLISFVLFEGVRYKVVEKVVVFVLNPIVKPLLDEMLQEDAERKARIANGEDVEMITGKDTVLEWGEFYYIMREGLENQKVLHFEQDNVLPHILAGIDDYSFYKGSLYIISKEGYAVIDSDDVCKVFITVPMEEFVAKKEYGINSEGERMFYSGKVDSNHVIYLDAFSEYSYDEQNKLKEMIDKQAK